MRPNKSKRGSRYAARLSTSVSMSKKRGFVSDWSRTMMRSAWRYNIHKQKYYTLSYFE